MQMMMQMALQKKQWSQQQERTDYERTMDEWTKDMREKEFALRAKTEERLSTPQPREPLEYERKIADLVNNTNMPLDKATRKVLLSGQKNLKRIGQQKQIESDIMENRQKRVEEFKQRFKRQEDVVKKQNETIEKEQKKLVNTVKTNRSFIKDLSSKYEKEVNRLNKILAPTDFETEHSIQDPSNALAREQAGTQLKNLNQALGLLNEFRGVIESGQPISPENMKFIRKNLMSINKVKENGVSMIGDYGNKETQGAIAEQTPIDPSTGKPYMAKNKEGKVLVYVNGEWRPI